jgi:hypothetical protein
VEWLLYTCDDSVYSEEYDYYLYDNNAVSVINEIDEDGSQWMKILYGGWW